MDEAVDKLREEFCSIHLFHQSPTNTPSSSLFIPPLSSSHTSVSGCLKGQLAVVVYHHYQCLHMNAQSLIYVSSPPPPSLCFDNVSLAHCTTPCLFLSHPRGTGRECLWVWEGDAKDREKKGVEERGRRGEVLHFCWIKPWRGDRLGTTSQAEPGLLPFVHGGSLRKGGEGKMESQQSAFWERKVCRSERMCGVRCVGMCFCVET